MQQFNKHHWVNLLLEYPKECQYTRQAYPRMDHRAFRTLAPDSD